MSNPKKGVVENDAVRPVGAPQSEAAQPVAWRWRRTDQIHMQSGAHKWTMPERAQWVYWYPDEKEHHHPQKFIDHRDPHIEVQRVFTHPVGGGPVEELKEAAWAVVGECASDHPPSNGAIECLSAALNRLGASLGESDD